MAMALNFENTMRHRYDIVSKQVDNGLLCVRQFQNSLTTLIDCMAKDPVKATEKMSRQGAAQASKDSLRRVWSACDTVQNMLLSHLVAHREFFSSIRRDVVGPLDALLKENTKMKKQLDDTMKKLTNSIAKNKKDLSKMVRKCEKSLDELKANIRSYRLAKKTLKLSETTKKMFQTYEDLQQKTAQMQEKLHTEVLPRHLKQFENMEKYRLKIISKSLKSFYKAFNERGIAVKQIVTVLERPTTMEPEVELADCLMDWSDSYGPPSSFVETVPYMLACRPHEISLEKFDAEIPRKRQYDEDVSQQRKMDKEELRREKERRNANREAIKQETQRVLSGGTPAAPSRKPKKSPQLSANQRGISPMTSPMTSPMVPNRPGNNAVSNYFGASMDLTMRKPGAPRPEEQKFTYLLQEPDPEKEKRLPKQKQKENKRRRNRNKTVHEVWTTEKSFVKSLTRIVEHYLTPLEGNPTLASRDQVKSIFSNIQTIQGLNQKFLIDLEKRLGEWDEIDCVGEIFKEITPYFKMYTTYVNNHESATQTLKALDDRGSEKWTAFIMDTQKRVPPLSSLLITPIQRVPRYRLLIQEILKNTDADHPDYKELNEALKLVREVANSINESVKLRENRDEIRKVESLFSGTVSFIAPSRKFIHRGQLIKKCRRNDVLYEFFLFNDLLIYASKLPGTGKLKLHRAIDIDASFSVKMDANLTSDKPSIVVNNSNKSFVVYGESLETVGEWMELLQTAKKEYDQKRGNRGDKKSNEVHAKAVWAQDNTSSNCVCCNTAFTIYKRRHHCRKCGSLVCSNCSKRRMKMAGSSTPVRVCDGCLGRGYGRKATDEILPSPKRSGPSIRKATVVKPPARRTNVPVITPGHKEVDSSSSEEEELVEEYYEGDEVEQPAPGTDGAKADLEGPFPPNWIMYLTEDDKTAYYYNAATQETVWDRPR